jgi:hypothetical protein
MRRIDCLDLVVPAQLSGGGNFFHDSGMRKMTDTTESNTTPYFSSTLKNSETAGR